MAEKADRSRSPEPEDNAYIRTAVTLGNVEIILEWLRVEEHKKDAASITDLVLVPAAMYGQLGLLKHALEFGDLSKQDTDSMYPGWTLMHFAVEGAQRVVVLHHKGDEVVYGQTNEPNNRYLTADQPKSEEEVRWKQMDIIMMLYRAGVPPALEDDNGDSASDRACRRLEDPFLEGAMLLDILTILSAQRTESEAQPHMETPGLSCIPSGRGWKRAMQQLTEWAYHREQYEILQFCHKKKFVEIDSPNLLLTSSEFSLRQHRRPLLMDALMTGNFTLLRIILTTPPVKHDVFSRMYEYKEGNSNIKRSILSYACEAHFNPPVEGGPDVLRSLLSKDVVGVHLTNVTVTGVGLRYLPVVLFHSNLQTLDVRENILDQFPTNDPTQATLGWDCPQLEILNISHNHFVNIPKEIFLLKSLARLIASNNAIKYLPMEMWAAPSLKILDLSDNQVQCLPHHNPHPRVAPTFSSTYTHAHHRQGRVLINQALPLESLRHGYINYDIDSSTNLHKGQVGFALQTLDLSGNHLTEVPRSLPCLCPLLQTLKMARNNLTRLGQAADYPPHLQMLDVKNNGIVGCLMPTLHPPTINCVQSQVVSAPTLCSHVQHESLSSLKFLYISSNRLEELLIEYDPAPLEGELEDSQQSSNSSQSQEPKKLLFPKLQGLQISHNRLTALPGSIIRLEKLCELAFDGNSEIEQLPHGLYQLSNLFTLRYDGTSDPVVQELANFKTTPEVLYYLKARESQAVVNQSMRLFVIGHFSKGKTTLLEALKGHVRKTGIMNSFDVRNRRIGSDSDSLTLEERGSTVGIELGRWSCSHKKKHKTDAKISFYTWDFAGQEEYYVTHQCFLTNRALYLLVWNVEDGSLGIESLSIWLQNMQAQAQGYSHHVIIVGTHLDKIPRAEREAKKRKWTEELERYNAGRSSSRVFPKIAAVAFVGCVPGKSRFLDVDVLNDIIYDTAMAMKAPKDFTSATIGLSVNILEEKIPKSYELLRMRIEDLAAQLRKKGTPPVLRREEFCDRVKDIVDTDKEIDIAVRFLHTTTGVVLHFDQPLIADYFIVDPQRWFDLCALVIAPDNVSSLVMNTGRLGDERYGLLSCKDMNEQFEHQRCDSKVSKIIRTFLCQFHIIHQISKDYCLVPSAISAIPMLPKDSELGSFPKKADLLYTVQQPMSLGPSLPSVLPLACNSPDDIQLVVTPTGLIYRRFILLPPIASGFWSKLIALFLQKRDFNKLVEGATPPELGLKAMGPAHRLRAHIGNIEFVWSYWKTGIMLYLGECVALRVNSFQSHEFEDPLVVKSVHSTVFSSRVKMLRQFIYRDGRELRSFPPHYKEVIEVVVPEVQIESKNLGSGVEPRSKPLSARLLAKALEIVDEVVKSHCEHLSTSGIYSHTDMAHVIPCPVCYGDKDHRGRQAPPSYLEEDDDMTVSGGYDPTAALGPGRVPVFEDPPLEESREEELDSLTQAGSIFVLTVESIIKETFTSDVVSCIAHKELEIEYLAPDLVFADLVDVKLDKTRFYAQIDKDEAPVARGSFGKVFRNSLSTDTEGDLDVAVKVFDQPDAGPIDVTSEIIRSYADMRYELNKLSTLDHPYIVRFIGVLTNPHSFVLEWAPMKSLEHIRANHAQHHTPLCAQSIFLTLLQVTNALTYLHRKVGIVHQDLRCSNILVFKFPCLGHCCYQRSKFAGCDVCVKVTDMGISANPLVHRAGEAAGIKLLVPECLTANTVATLTEKVDMFCLGSCLYELMTLRGLPPADISQPEYSIMLQSGKRAQFHAKDPSYPLYLFQTLEDCWQQQHYDRPSAELLCGVLMQLTGLDFNTQHKGYESRELGAVLLDSYTLHHDKRVARSEVICTEGKVDLCVALATRDDMSTTIATVKYHTDVKTELHMESSGTIKNNTVLALHRSVDGHIFVGCADGTLNLYDSSHVKYVTNPAESCSSGIPHGDIVKVFYDPSCSLLVIGFASGRVHIEKCTQGVVKSVNSNAQWRVFCGLLESSLELQSMECVVVGAEGGGHRMDIWYGAQTSSVEVWSLSVPPHTTWARDTVEKCREIHHIRLPGVDLGEGSFRGAVNTRIVVSEDKSKMVVLYQTSGKRAACQVVVLGVESRECIKSFHWEQSVASVVLTSRRLALGTFNGEVFVYDAQKLLETDSDLSQSRHSVLRAHKPKSRIYSMACIEGHIGTGGSTSVFPAYIGRSDSNVPKDFFLTVGYGREYTDLGSSSGKIFKNSLRKGGVFVNVWML